MAFSLTLCAVLVFFHALPTLIGVIQRQTCSIENVSTLLLQMSVIHVRMLPVTINLAFPALDAYDNVIFENLSTNCPSKIKSNLSKQHPHCFSRMDIDYVPIKVNIAHTERKSMGCYLYNKHDPPALPCRAELEDSRTARQEVSGVLCLSQKCGASVRESAGRGPAPSAQVKGSLGACTTCLVSNRASPWRRTVH